MDSCTGYIAGIVLLFVVMFGVACYFSMQSAQKPIEESNKAKREYVNSVRPTDGRAEDNAELMSQMRPSDEVMKYVDLRCNVKGREINGFIAVTKERLIFKTVAVGDNTAFINDGLANAARAQISFRFDMKEETANIPIRKVTSMSVSTQSVSLDNTGCNAKPNNGQGPTLSAYVLSINAQGIIYKLFLGQCGDIATEFSRTFTSMTFDDDE